jgi:hypothetical protein
VLERVGCHVAIFTLLVALVLFGRNNPLPGKTPARIRLIEGEEDVENRTRRRWHQRLRKFSSGT